MLCIVTFALLVSHFLVFWIVTVFRCFYINSFVSFSHITRVFEKFDLNFLAFLRLYNFLLATKRKHHKQIICDVTAAKNKNATLINGIKNCLHGWFNFAWRVSLNVKISKQLILVCIFWLLLWKSFKWTYKTWSYIMQSLQGKMKQMILDTTRTYIASTTISLTFSLKFQPLISNFFRFLFDLNSSPISGASQFVLELTTHLHRLLYLA